MNYHGGIIMKNNSYFSKVWTALSSTIFNNTEYAYDRNAISSRINDNYDITDTTELRLISSRRTFL